MEPVEKTIKLYTFIKEHCSTQYSAASDVKKVSIERQKKNSQQTMGFAAVEFS